MFKKKDINMNEELLRPFYYLKAMKGKQIRKSLILSFQNWFKIPQEPLEKIIEIIDEFHNASLLVDDIQDGSLLRRGQPCAHLKYGIAETISSATYMYFLTLEKVRQLNNHQAIEVVLDELVHLHHGQALDIYWRESQQCPTKEQYKNMVMDKTGGLFRMIVRLMQCFSECKNDYIELANLLGVLFQIRDDYSNLDLEHYLKSKGFCEDLSEGKFSYPIICALLSGDKILCQRILKILQLRTQDITIKREALDLIHATDAMKATRETINEVYDQVTFQITLLGGNTHLQKLVDLLCKGICDDNKNDIQQNVAQRRTSHELGEVTS